MSDVSVDWNYWNQVPTVEVWEAVLLTLNCDPRMYKVDPVVSGALRQGDPWDEGSLVKVSEYSQRVTIALKNLGDKQFPKHKNLPSNRDEQAKLRLDKFMTWAISKGWKMPKECSSLAAPPASSADTQKASINSNPNESTQLTVLKLASQKYWANADKNDKTSWPNTSEIEHWLEKNGFSPTLAQKGASIIRPEWAVSGRKPE